MLFEIGVEDQTRELDLGSMTIREGAECERLTGWTWDEWRVELAKGRATAVAFAWWLASKRAGEPVTGRFTDLDFDMGRTTFRRLDAEPEESVEEEGDDTRPTGLDREPTVEPA